MVVVCFPDGGYVGAVVGFFLLTEGRQQRGSEQRIYARPSGLSSSAWLVVCSKTRWKFLVPAASTWSRFTRPLPWSRRIAWKSLPGDGGFFFFFLPPPTSGAGLFHTQLQAGVVVHTHCHEARVLFCTRYTVQSAVVFTGSVIRH